MSLRSACTAKQWLRKWRIFMLRHCLVRCSFCLYVAATATRSSIEQRTSTQAQHTGSVVVVVLVDGGQWRQYTARGICRSDRIGIYIDLYMFRCGCIVLMPACVHDDLIESTERVVDTFGLFCEFENMRRRFFANSFGIAKFRAK